MKLSNNVNILPWYDSANYQNHKKDFANYGVFPLYAVNNVLPPFQIAIPSREDLLVEVEGDVDNYISMDAYLYNVDGSLASHNILSLGTNVLRKIHRGEYKQIINDGLLPITTATTLTGRYYISLNFRYISYDHTLYQFTLISEVITFISSNADLIKLEYWDNQTFLHTHGEIIYTSPYKNFVYLGTQVGKPEYVFEEEVSKRDGHSFVEKQVSEKRYKFEFLAPEYLCDALRIVRMHDNINITNIDSTIYNVESILINPKWQEAGDIAVVEVEFECDTVIKKIGKRFTPILINDDFGADFNTDFNNNTI